MRRRKERRKRKRKKWRRYGRRSCLRREEGDICTEERTPEEVQRGEESLHMVYCIFCCCNRVPDAEHFIKKGGGVYLVQGFGGCGDLNENGPQKLIYLNVDIQIVELFQD